jgi:hypothetical protein
VCIEKGELQEGEKNLFPINPSDISLEKSQSTKECMGDRNIRGDQTQKG